MNVVTFVIQVVEDIDTPHFLSTERWTLDELSSTMHVPHGLLRRRLAFWVSHGVLKEETTDNYVVIERQKGVRGAQGRDLPSVLALGSR